MTGRHPSSSHTQPPIKPSTSSRTMLVIKRQVFGPEVVESKLLAHEGRHWKMFLRLRRKKVLTAVLDSEYDVEYRPCWERVAGPFYPDRPGSMSWMGIRHWIPVRVMDTCGA